MVRPVSKISHRAGPVFRLLRFVFLAGLAGCAAPAMESLPGIDPLPGSSAAISGVPVYPDDDRQCGPATLASVLNYYGANVEPDEIAAEVYRPDLSGSLTLDLVLFAREKGFQVRSYTGRIADLIRAVDENRPPIVMLDGGVSMIARRHFAVAVGYGPEAVRLHTEGLFGKPMPWKDFIRQWDRAGRWALDIQPRTLAPPAK